jgi:hypothetical protein
MKLGAAIAEIMKREGIQILTGYPVNHLIEYAADADSALAVIANPAIVSDEWENLSVSVRILRADFS